MKFTPMTDEEIYALMPERKKPLKTGKAYFSVIDAEQSRSKSSEKYPLGNEMVKLKLKVVDDEGNEGFIYDYLVNSPNPFCQFKIKRFWQSVGEEIKYQSGRTEDYDFLSKSGECFLKIQKSEGYDDKIVVGEYIKSSNNDKKKIQQENVIEDDDIPF